MRRSGLGRDGSHLRGSGLQVTAHHERGPGVNATLVRGQTVADPSRDVAAFVREQQGAVRVACHHHRRVRLPPENVA